MPQSRKQIQAQQRAVRSALTAGVPPDAVAVFVRWWQLETWLRIVARIELRARFGHDWLKPASKGAADRAVRDRLNDYMASPDAEDPLAYLDTGELLGLIDSDDLWPMFESTLLPRVRWQGSADMLNAIRRRIAHTRRPHFDDLARLEQVLRDLEPGGQRFVRSFGARRRIWTTDDRVTDHWVGRNRDAARQLVNDALAVGVEFELRWSTRPWAAKTPTQQTSGMTGGIWHAEWTTRDRTLDARRIGNELLANESAASVIAVCQGRATSLSVAVPAAVEAESTVSAVEAAFEAVMRAVANTRVETPSSVPRHDFRIHVGDPLGLAHPEYARPIFMA